MAPNGRGSVGFYGRKSEMLSNERSWRSRSLLIGLVAVVVLLALIAYLQGPHRQEPVYRGKALTQWLKRLDDGQALGISSHALPAPTGRQIEAAEAIRAIGAEALPLLMEDIHATPSENALCFRAERSLNRAMRKLVGREIGFDGDTEEDRIRWRAARGLAALGPLAKPALPELQR